MSLKKIIKKLDIKRNCGIFFFVLSWLLYLIIFVISFGIFNIKIKIKLVLIPALYVLSHIFFWISIFLIGKKYYKKYKSKIFKGNNKNED